MAAQIAGQEARHRVKTGLARGAETLGRARLGTTLEQVETLAEGLSQLKGAAMKAGQMLSIDASDYLPPEAVEILGKLQSNAEPVPFSTMAEVLREDLGPDWAERLEGLEERPSASASIGQVHRARFDGREVAVKVQYPGIGESIDADLDLLRKLSGTWLKMSGRRIDLDEVFREMKEVLHQEADYRVELGHMQAFRELLAGDPTYVVPEPFAPVCSERVLVASWERGEPLRAWLGSHPSLETRRWLGRALLDLYCLEFFTWGRVQTDPNPGNFLVRPDERRVVLLDFGATLVYDDEFRRQYIELLRVLGAGDRGRVIELGVAQGLLDVRESKEVKDLFADLLISAVEPFVPELQPFEFADEDYAARARDIGVAFTRSLRYSPPPRKLIFLHRKLGGLFNILKRMQLSLDLSPYWEQMVGTDIQSAA